MASQGKSSSELPPPEPAGRHDLPVFERVLRLGKEVTQMGELREVILRIHTAARHGLGFDRASIWLHDPVASLFRGTFGTSTEGEVTEEWDLSYAAPNWGGMLSDPAWLLHVKDYPATEAAHRETMQGVREHAGVALWSGEKPLGVLNVDNLPTQRPFTDDQIAALRLFAGYAGVAIENARLMEAAQASRKWLHDVMSHARCVVWSGEVVGLPGWEEDTDGSARRFEWPNSVMDEQAAQEVLPLDVPPGQTYAQAWVASRNPQDDHAMHAVAAHALIRGADRYAQEFRCTDRHGQLHWLHEDVVLSPVSHGYWQCYGIVTNVTERKLAEEALALERARLRTVIDNLPDALYMKDAQSRVVLCNTQAVRAAGLSTEQDMLGKTDLDLHPSREAAERWFAAEQELLRSGIPMVNKEEFHVLPDGSWRSSLSTKIPLRDHSGAIVSLLCINRDVSDLRRLEEQLSQAQKMDAIGQLAGGIAHDLNNQITPVMGYAEMLVNRLEDERLRQYADSILKSAARAADLTRDLLAFARKGKFLSTEVDVHRVIVETVAMLERSIDKRIAVRQLLNARPSHVKGDPTQLQNALLNLALNARDAMPSGGELTFATSVTELSERPFGFALAAGRYLQLSVIDTGVGMDEETRKHLFEPFFTTKEKGKGTGLGLAAVYGTVKNHHGAVIAQSQLGRGASFTIYLPVLESVSAAEPAAAGVEEQAEGDVHILIVDDEKDVGELVSDALRDLGYKVMACSSSEEAIGYYAKAWEHIDLVILDMVMPKMGGRDVFVAMRRINPHIKALLASGYGLDGEAQSILDSGVLGFLQKPFRMTELSRKVAEVLRGA